MRCNRAGCIGGVPALIELAAMQIQRHPCIIHTHHVWRGMMKVSTPYDSGVWPRAPALGKCRTSAVSACPQASSPSHVSYHRISISRSHTCVTARPPIAPSGKPVTDHHHAQDAGRVLCLVWPLVIHWARLPLSTDGTSNTCVLAPELSIARESAQTHLQTRRRFPRGTRRRPSRRTRLGRWTECIGRGGEGPCHASSPPGP